MSILNYLIAPIMLKVKPKSPQQFTRPSVIFLAPLMPLTSFSNFFKSHLSVRAVLATLLNITILLDMAFLLFALFFSEDYATGTN